MAVTVIAEIGVNHDGKGSKACQLVDAAKAAGADVVKFQTFNPNRLFRPGLAREKAWKLTLDTYHAQMVLAHCHNVGIEFMSTPDDLDSLKWLVEVARVRRIKLGSGSLLYEPLVDAAFDTGLPVLLSTGMARHEEVDGVLLRQFLRKHVQSLSHLTLMHCVSLYPCPNELANVGVLAAYQQRRPQWRVGHFEVGYSDHTRGIMAAIMAVALGATVIEKHFTLDRTDPGPDHRMSMNPAEFTGFVATIREAEVIAGTGLKVPSEQERAMIPRVRKDADGYQPGL